MRTNNNFKFFLTLLMLLLITARLPLPAGAHSGDAIEAELGEKPEIDGVVEADEWEDANSLTLSVEGNDAEIFFKHDRDRVYMGFDIQEGHNSVFPDTRIFLDLLHDGAESPQEDDFELYINPDNGGLRERQGDGDQWQTVDVEDWDGDWDEDDSNHWTTEYEIESDKFLNFTGNETLGIAFMVYGNTPNGFDVWPDNADIDDPSTWGNITFPDWVNKTDDKDEEPDPGPGGNDTDPNGTDTNDTKPVDEDDDEGFLPGFSALMVAATTVVVGSGKRKRRRREE